MLAIGTRTVRPRELKFPLEMGLHLEGVLVKLRTKLPTLPWQGRAGQRVLLEVLPAQIHFKNALGLVWAGQVRTSFKCPAAGHRAHCKSGAMVSGAIEPKLGRSYPHGLKVAVTI